jgi:hypothetical protein
MAEVVEHLPTKHKSAEFKPYNPTTTKKIKN